jgi:hypothetical protein
LNLSAGHSPASAAVETIEEAMTPAEAIDLRIARRLAMKLRIVEISFVHLGRRRPQRRGGSVEKRSNGNAEWLSNR